MPYNIARQINDIVQSSANAKYVIGEVNHLLSSVEINEQLAIHGQLSMAALDFMYRNMEYIEFTDEGMCEHITWQYFSNLIGEEPPSNEILDKLLLEYQRNQYIGIESIVVGALKDDMLTDTQMLKASTIMSSKIIVKECYAYNCRKKISLGQCLSEEEISRLLDARSYSTIELAIKKHKVSLNGIHILVKPYEGQNDKKIRLKILQQAQQLKEE